MKNVFLGSSIHRKILSLGKIEKNTFINTMGNSSKKGRQIKNLQRSFGDESNTRRAFFIMLVGIILALGFGFGLPLLFDEQKSPYLFQIIGISSALFTIAGFWAAFFQLQSVKELKGRREFEVIKATGELLKGQLIGRISRTRSKLLSFRKLIGEGNYSFFLTESEYTVQKLEQIRSNDWIEQTDKRLIAEYVNNHRSYETILRESVSRNEILSELVTTNYLGRISYICIKLNEAKDKLAQSNL